MKILIAYSSNTGNTKKIADAMYEECTKADFLNIKDVKEFESYDLIILGGWIDKGTFNNEVIERLDEIKNKNVVFFFTLGKRPTDMHAYRCVQNIKKSLTKNNNNVLGHYHCMGQISKQLRDKMSEMFKASKKEKLDEKWELSNNRPNEKDVVGAKEFIKAILEELNVTK